jgi:excinuclease ABC subunit B
MTDSMRRAIDETDRRRVTQVAYNEEHGITPESILRPIDMSLAQILKAEYADLAEQDETTPEFGSQQELDAFAAKLEAEMREAAKKFEFEKAAKLRDRVKDLRTKEFLFG